MIEAQTLLMAWVVYLVVQAATLYGIYWPFKYHAYPRPPRHRTIILCAVLVFVLFWLCLFEVGLVLRGLIVLTLDFWGVPWFRQ